MPVMQRACAQSTSWPSARGSGTSLPLPVHLCGLLQIQGLQLHGGCGPLFWLADCAAITRWFFRSCKMPTRSFRYIRHCRRTIVRWRTGFHGRGDTTTVVKLGVQHRLSSVALAHLHCPAEHGVKTCKRMLMDNTGPNGEIHLDKFQRGMLQYRNTPDRDTDLSPAQMIFGRRIKDFIPILPGSYRPHNTWIETSRAREEGMRARNVRNAERLTEHTVQLQPLKVRDWVFIQNQTVTIHCDGIEPA